MHLWKSLKACSYPRFVGLKVSHAGVGLDVTLISETADQFRDHQLHDTPKSSCVEIMRDLDRFYSVFWH